MPVRPQPARQRSVRPWHVALVLFGAHLTLPAGAVEAKFNALDPLGYAKKRHDHEPALTIDVAPGDWGGVSVREIRLVLESVAREFVSHVDSQRAGELAIRVVPRSGSPKVLYEQHTAGEYVIQLTARDARWYQYAYQFSHELCHVFTNFDHKVHRDEHVPEHNQWFEESLCETASLFTLKQLAAKWESDPPTRNWAGYDKLMSGYARRLLAEPHRRLAANQTFRAWFAEHQASLRDNPYLREKNELVATTLLPLFESHPDYWQAIKYLNPELASADKPFDGYLTDWLDACPDKRLPAEILSLFGLVAARGADARAGLEAGGASASPEVPLGAVPGGGPAGPVGN